MGTKQLSLYEAEVKRTASSTTFADNLSLGVHRWFRYSAGFSASWVAEVIGDFQKGRTETPRILDPFSGSGTTILEAQSLCVPSIGLEAHPFVYRVAKAKLNWEADLCDYQAAVEAVVEAAANMRPQHDEQDHPLLTRVYTPDSLSSLLRLRDALKEQALPDDQRSLLWLTLCSILRECSTAGTAQWQYLLPNQQKARVADPVTAFRKRSLLFASDMRNRQAFLSCRPQTEVTQDDARTCVSVESQSIDLVLTSPPYANNYDYADATRLEMTFFGEIAGWADLHESVRKYLVRSCSQHAVAIQKKIPEMISDPKLAVIASGLGEACESLSEIRESKGGKKPYHALIAAYFFDMADVWTALRRVVKPGGRACFVIGDSAPYGVHIPVDKWHGDLAVSAGFSSYSFEKTRDRNTKWKNRKHTVPLHEGRLWVEG